MKERFKELLKKLISIKVLIGLPAAIILRCLNLIDVWAFVGIFIAILGLREISKVTYNNGK